MVISTGTYDHIRGCIWLYPPAHMIISEGGYDYVLGHIWLYERVDMITLQV
jgi:hypothetical protein